MAGQNLTLCVEGSVIIRTGQGLPQINSNMKKIKKITCDIGKYGPV